MNENLIRGDIACQELKKALSAPNHLTLIICSHYTIERFLRLAVSHAVSFSDFSEFERLPFMARVELAIVLSLLDKKAYPLLKAFNKVRNRFAHNPFSALSQKDANDLRNCFSDRQRKMVSAILKKPIGEFTELEIVHWTVIPICLELRASAEGKIRDRVSHTVTMRDIKDVMDSIPEEMKRETIAAHNTKVSEEMRKMLGGEG